MCGKTKSVKNTDIFQSDFQSNTKMLVNFEYHLKHTKNQYINFTNREAKLVSTGNTQKVMFIYLLFKNK